MTEVGVGMTGEGTPAHTTETPSFPRRRESSPPRPTQTHPRTSHLTKQNPRTILNLKTTDDPVQTTTQGAILQFPTCNHQSTIINSPTRHLQNSTKYDRMPQNTTETRARAFPNSRARTHEASPPRHSREGGNSRARTRGIPSSHSRTLPRHSREGGNLPLRPGRSRFDASLWNCRPIAAMPINQTEPRQPPSCAHGGEGGIINGLSHYGDAEIPAFAGMTGEETLHGAGREGTEAED